MIAFSLFFQPSMSFATEPALLELVTAQEAAAPDIEDISLYVDASQTDSGPAIEVISPKNGQALKGAVPINVRFLKKAGTEIDLATFKVEYLKFITIDLTPRVRQYVTRDGINVPETKLPSGTHRIRMSVGDNTGMVTRQIFAFEVL